ncbi:MAG: DUF222 domain-containing protein [Microbacteriaceae bacterium]|jgi:hypothetical protein|nr:DUF222 domain-containing protein [Microbacteriaceae bacterium]HPZ34392.1 DUF222 domain-containing protein [Microbacteriaceae bacterium]HQC93134.1 DUF222 domain-containing protein [Microbacteriaceae bacterium]
MARTGYGIATPAERAQLDAAYAGMARARAKINAWQAREAEFVHTATQIAGAIAARGEATSRASELPYREVAAEIGGALRISDRSAQRLMGESTTLVQDFPATFAAFRAGRISRTHVHAITDCGSQLPDAAARASYEASVVPYAEQEVPARVRPFARVTAERVHPTPFAERHEAAARCRGVRVIDVEDGMSELIATLPSTLAHGALDRVQQLAQSVRDAEAAVTTQGGRSRSGAPITSDGRSIDELRADIVADLLLTGAPEGHAAVADGAEPGALGAIRAHVQVTVPVLSLMGHTNAPATLAGVGPLDAATARALAGASSGWDRILTDPISGTVLAVDRYTPTVQLKRTLQVRDQHCRFPGCRQPVHRSDIDHTIDYALGGHTREGNLAHLCRRHHTLKHASAWRVVHKPDGILEWTSPTGRVYPDIPTSSVMFRPESDWDEHRLRAGAERSAGVGGGRGVGAGTGSTRHRDDPPPF